jgi:hypothetical protein
MLALISFFRAILSVLFLQFMDNWVTLVYGKSRSVKLPDVTVKHLTYKHSTRYSVDNNPSLYLRGEVQRGRFIIERFLESDPKHEKALNAYKSDNFNYHL